MSTFRILLTRLPLPGSSCPVPPDQVHHLLHVRRYAAGDTIECIDRDGHVCPAAIDSVCGSLVTMTITGQARDPAPLPRILLYPALLPEKKFDWLLQKCTELGVAECHPLRSERCVVKITDDSGNKKRERWQRICDDAGRQCCGAPMRVFPPCSLPDCFADQSNLKILADIDGVPLSLANYSASKNNSPSLALLIGPEGGFTPEEQQSAMQHNWQPVCFHHTILRAETAAVVCSVLLMHWSEEC